MAAVVYQQDFFHYLSRLIQSQGSDNELVYLNQKKLTIKPKASLNFPARDIDQLQRDEETVQLVCQFMGLYGVDSPLPLYFNQHCLGESREHQMLRDFLDIFNHRNYALYFFAWRAFYPEAALSHHDTGYIDFIRYIAGFHHHPMPLALSNSYGKVNLSAIESLIKSHMPDISFIVQPPCAGWVSIENKSVLSQVSSMQLGNNTLVGDKVMTDQQILKIVLGPVGWEKLELIKQQIKIIYDLLEPVNSLGINCFFKILVTSQPNENQLGKQSLTLGEGTWLGLGRESSFVLSSDKHQMG